MGDSTISLHNAQRIRVTEHSLVVRESKVIGQSTLFLRIDDELDRVAKIGTGFE